MSELDNNIKKVLDHFGVKTIEEAIEYWNKVNRDMYHLFNCTTLPISLSKQLVVFLKTFPQIKDTNDSKILNYNKTIDDTVEILERQLKPYTQEQKQDG